MVRPVNLRGMALISRVLLALAVSLFLGVSATWAQSGTLDVTSKDAYDASIVAMARNEDPAFARSLIFTLLKLAAAEEPVLSQPEAMRLFMQSPDEMFRRLAQYQGKTAAELKAAADAL